MNLGLPELLVIVLFAFLIIGPEKLPQLGKTIGKVVGQFRDAQNKVNDSLKKEGLDTESLQQAAQNPFLALTKVEELADKAARFGGDGAAEAVAETGGAASPAGGDNASAEGSSANPPAGEAVAKDGAGRKVLSLSDKETFTQRKLRLQTERVAAGEAPAEPSAGGGASTSTSIAPADSGSPAEGGGDSGA